MVCRVTLTWTCAGCCMVRSKTVVIHDITHALWMWDISTRDAVQPCLLISSCKDLWCQFCCSTPLPTSLTRERALQDCLCASWTQANVSLPSGGAMCGTSKHGRPLWVFTHGHRGVSGMAVERPSGKGRASAPTVFYTDLLSFTTV